MPALKTVVAALVALVVAAGAVTAAGGVPGAADVSEPDEPLPADVEADVVFDDGTVTVTVADDGTAVENVSVTVEADDVEQSAVTDANGTVAVDVGANATELEVELEGDAVEGELEYVVTDDGLRLVEESYEYDVAVDDEDEADDEDDADEEDEAENDEADEESDADEDDEEDDEDDADDEDEEEADADEEEEVDDDAGDAEA